MYFRQPQYGAENAAMVAVKVGLHRQEKILIIQHYCQWKLLGKPGEETDKVPKQIERFAEVIEMWKCAIDVEKEVHFVGDLNLDGNCWDTPKQTMSEYEKSLYPMIENIKNDIMSKGIHRFILGDTWIQPKK